MHTGLSSSSLLEHLLCWLFEFASTFVHHLLFLNFFNSQVCSLHPGAILPVLLLGIVVGPLLRWVTLINCRTVTSIGLVWRLDHWCLSTGNLFCDLFLRLLSWLFPNHIEHWVFKSFLVLAQSVLLPGVIHNLAVILVSDHARFEKSGASFIIWFLFEFECSTVVHELSEFVGNVAA